MLKVRVQVSIRGTMPGIVYDDVCIYWEAEGVTLINEYISDNLLYV